MKILYKFYQNHPGFLFVFMPIFGFWLAPLKKAFMWGSDF